MAGFKGLDKQDITFDFGQGTEQKFDSKRVPIGKLVDATNVFFTKDKQLRRRYGTSQTFTTSGYVARLLPIRGTDTIGAYDGNEIKIPVSGSAKTLLNSNAAIFGAGITGQINTVAVRGVTLPACAVAGDSTYTVTAYMDVNAVTGNTVRAIVQNVTTQSVLAELTLSTGFAMSTEEYVKVFISGSSAYVFYRESTNIYCHPITLSSSPSAASRTAVVSSGTTYNNGWDVQQDGTSFYFAYRNSTPNILVSKRTFASPGTTTWSNTQASAGTDCAVCLASPGLTTPTTVVVYFAESGAIKYYTASASAGTGAATGTYKAAAFTGGTLQSMSAAYIVSSSDSVVMLNVSGTSPTGYYSKQHGATASLTTAAFTHTRGETVSSGLFPLYSGSTLLAYMVRSQGFVGINVLASTATPGTTLARVSQEFDPWESRDSDGVWSNATPFIVGTKLYFPLWLMKTSRATSSGISSCAFGNVSLDFSEGPYTTLAATSMRPTVADDTVYFGGAAAFAGEANSGVLFPPKFISYAGTAGTMNSGVTYTFFAVLTFIDSRGKKHYSPLGTVDVTGSTGYNLTVAWPLTLSQLIYSTQEFTAELYCNPVNTALWYKVQSSAVGTSTIVFTVTADPTGAEELLYTTGGAYENIPPAMPRFVMSAARRLWCPSPENDTDLFHSSETLVNEDVRWNPDMVVRIPGVGGQIKAVIEHAQRIVVFKERAIYVVSGDGLSLTGASGVFSVELLTPSYGCESSHGLQLTPNGVVFKDTDNGWWLLGNDFGLSYVGRGVDDLKTATVVASCVVPALNHVRFLLDTDHGGYVLCYDYAYQQWSFYTFPAVITDMCVGNDGAVYYLYSNATTSRIYKENSIATSDIDDAGVTTDIDFRIETGWLNFNGVDGYQRVYFFDVQHSNDGADPLPLNVDAYFDYYDDVSPQSATLNLPENTDPTFRQGGRMYFKQQKCVAVKLVLTPVADGTQDRWASGALTALVFRVGAKTTAAPALGTQRATIKPA